MARIRPPLKWGIFFSSYIPLFAILLYKQWDISTGIPGDYPIIGGQSIPYLRIIWISLIILSLISLLWVYFMRITREGEPTQVMKAKSRNDAITNYILVYIFPFVLLDFNETFNWIVFISLFFLIGIIQVRSNHLFVNPVIGIAGYNIYEVDTDKKRITLLVKGRIEDHPTNVTTVELSPGVHMAV